MITKQEIKFPKGFLWGTATSSYQIEGNNKNSDWWPRGGQACDSWNRWEEDLKLIKESNNNCYRFSIEWARIEPEQGKFDLEALKQYQDQIKTYHQNNIKVVLTLWHYTMPRWFTKKGGLEKKENLMYFFRYVSFILDNLDEYPDYWLTLNEPNNVYIARAYLIKSWPPFSQNPIKAVLVLLNLVEAHKKAYQLIHQKVNHAQVGMASNCMSFSVNNWPLGWVKDLIEYLTTYIFLDLTKNHHDFIGLNYYMNQVINWRWLLGFGRYWENDPGGIYQVILALHQRYKLPIFITENGFDSATDEKRSEFIYQHLLFVQKAMEKGIKIIGYLYWSLVDNFEWSYGFGPKYGLYSCDQKTFERKPRPSAKFYSEICKTNCLRLS